MQEHYPKPFYVRLLGPSDRAAVVRLVYLFVALIGVGWFFDWLLSLSSHFIESKFYLFNYTVGLVFGLWVVVHMYWKARETFTDLKLVQETSSCLREVYSNPRIVITALVFAIFVGAVQFALRFKLPWSVTVYLVLWNMLGGFIIGLGISMALGSVKLAAAIGKLKFQVLILCPAQTPELKCISRLMWTYSLLFTLEVVILSVAVTVASVTLGSKAGKFFNGALTGLDIGGATAFFFLAIFSPIYTFALQKLTFRAAERGRAETLSQIDSKIRTAIASSDAEAHEELAGWLSASDAVAKTNPLPLNITNVSKLLTMLVPGLVFLYNKNSDAILHILKSIVRLFFPSFGA